jgi:DNA-binding transcriptional MerR regulator
MKNQTYSIGDVSKRTNVSLKQIRRWEAKGYITEAERVVSGHFAYRRFTLKQIEMISSIKAFLDEGYTLSAAAKKAKTSNLQQRKESTPGGSD